jgi:hypothetical protein
LFQPLRFENVKVTLPDPSAVYVNRKLVAGGEALGGVMTIEPIPGVPIDGVNVPPAPPSEITIV